MSIPAHYLEEIGSVFAISDGKIDNLGIETSAFKQLPVKVKKLETKVISIFSDDFEFKQSFGWIWAGGAVHIFTLNMATVESFSCTHLKAV